MDSIVVKATGSWYEVLTQNGIVHCRIRGKLRLKGVRSTSPVVVGDQVSIEKDESMGDWCITEIHPRRNYMIRRASNLSKESHIIAANIDMAYIVVSRNNPETPLEFIDRMLVTCEAYKIPATIILNKVDLLSNDEIESFHRIYSNTGYEVIDFSVIHNIGLSALESRLEGKTSLFTGNSGVGKSSIISLLLPNEKIRTGEVSDAFHKGKHTTTFSTMYNYSNRGFIIDTPGIKGFGLIDISEKELSHYFPEMMSRLSECRFYNCTHRHEPGCAVIEALQNGTISSERYESYLKILDEDDKYRK
ncbi:MAG: ribosome small subunit-dependent GTPase A [Alistipes sp.]|nr:ribosome small subunit-dependent GTPase A [Candidatus Alistipes equi]